MFKFRNFYDHIDFTPDQCLAITKAIIELIDSSGSPNLVQKTLHGRKKFKEDVKVFYEEDEQILPCYHNRPLYAIAFIHDVDVEASIGRSRILSECNASANTRGDGDLSISSGENY